MRWLSKILNKICRSKNVDIEEEIEEEEEKEGPQPLGLLQFVLLENGNVDVKCDWVIEGQDVAKTYGEMLYYITNGKLSGVISNILIDCINNETHSQVFIRTILASWFLLLQKNDNSPIIKPSAALSPHKNGEEE